MCSYTTNNYGGCWGCDGDDTIELTPPIRSVLDGLDMVVDRIKILGVYSYNDESLERFIYSGKEKK